jgi:histidinol phosphatase-like enzyme (inositol monophosphatase family)
MALTAHRKADDSPVTRADREAEMAMRALIESSYPAHGIYGEEFGIREGSSDYVWVLDPIDGTKSFITGRPLFGTLIALLEGGVPRVGVVDFPALDRRWVGADGVATEEAGVACVTSNVTELIHARLASTSITMFEGAARAVYERLADAVWFPIYGGDCFAYASLASGHVDLVVEAQLEPYDYLSMVTIVEGAGGCISDWRGAPLTLESDGRVLASANRELHHKALALLRT